MGNPKMAYLKTNPQPYEKWQIYNGTMSWIKMANWKTNPGPGEKNLLLTIFDGKKFKKNL